MVIYSIDKKFENADGDQMSVDIKALELNPEENMVKKQKVILMRSVVDKLKPRYKQLVEMRYFEELSYEEISDKLNLPLGTVKAQLFRAREFLANILRNTEGRI